ncbi:MAG: molybdopterin cofactor-binding domain-containing protein [Salinarimonas sp.]
MSSSRRSVLKALGWSAAGITLLAGGVAAFPHLPALPHRDAPTPDDAVAWLSLRPDGRIALVSPRAEMGQGVATALRQIVAEEIGVALERVAFVHPRTDLLPPARATVGSDSIKDYGPLLARAAAAMGDAIRARAAERLGVPGAALAVDGDGVRTTDGRAVPLVGLADPPLLLGAEALAAARPRSLARDGPLRVVGTSPEPAELRAILTGSAPLFTDDVRLPRMTHGAVLRPPVIGARLARVDARAAEDVPGFVALVRERGFTGVVAESRGALERALAALDATWEEPSAPITQAGIDAAVDIDAALARGALEHVVVDEGGVVGPPAISLRLDVPMAAHAAMEPRCAVADLSDGRLTVHTGTQDATFVRRVLAADLGLSEDRVVVRGHRLGGGFGGRTICDVERDAARLSRAVGRPVKVQRSRAEEFATAFHRPPSSHRITARLDDAGRITSWDHAMRSGHVIFTSAAMGPVLQAATSFVADPGVARGLVPPYAIARRRIAFEDVRLPVDTGPWRGLGAAPNVWAIETAIDALARAAGRDPVSFRLAAIAPEHPRLASVLERAAALADWPARRTTPRRGYGVACGVYKEMATAAVVARVALDESGAARVERLWCAHECGLVVDPDGVRAQVESNLIWSVGMALGEELSIVDGRIGAQSQADYALPRFSDTPEIEIALVDGGGPPAGAGETAIVAGVAAITNAIAAATGRTVTRLPWRAEA